MMFGCIIIVVLTEVLTAVGAIGAPPGVCFGMIPRQPAEAQTSYPPYSIVANVAVVKPGTSIGVIVRGMTPRDTMSGILLQARQGDKIVGKWTVDPNDTVAQLLDCGEPGNTVTHKEHVPELDKQTVSYLWTAPSDLKGEVKFKVTVIKSYGIFWVGLESAPVKILKSSLIV